MKRFLRYFFWIIFLSMIFTVLFWYLRPNDTKKIIALSPVPDFLTISKNKQVRLLDLWLPFIQKTEGSGFEAPDISAKSALIFNMTTNKVLYEKNARERLPMASLTKIMTAIISLENKRNDDRYTVYGSNLVGEDSMGLSTGEVLTQEELLYGLMLPSGNDAAEVLASDSPLGREGFIKAMNDKAKSLGLTDTLFDNPSGLQGDGRQYTTTYDLLVITRYALENFPLFAQVVSTYEKDISQTAAHKEYDLINETNLLTSYDGVKGVKTGYTPEAGLCLVSYLDYHDQKILGVLLDSEDRRGEMRLLLDYSLKSIGIEPPEFRGG